MRKVSMLSMSTVLVILLAILYPRGIVRSANVPLTDCQFQVGIGSAKYEVAAQCGVLTVPEDYLHPEGRTLAIHFTVLAPLTPDAKGLPIFHLEGGPGGSAVSNFGEAWFGAYETLRRDHPVVLIDQRGTGTSASLQCTEITDAALSDLAKLSSPTDDADLNSKRLAQCLTRLSRTTDPQFYTSNALADDTDAVRAALGYDQIDVFGNSYGTSLGQVYLKRHGVHVAALVLDSVTGPWNQWALDATTNGAAALDKTFALCKADAACAKAYPDLAGDLQKALDTLKAQPRTISALSALTVTSHSVGMTPGRLLGALYEMLYNSANIGLIPSSIHSAANGDYTFPAGVLIAEAELAPEISQGLYESVVCSELVPFWTDALIKQYKTDTLFSAIDTPNDYISGCKAWRSAELSAADVAPVVSDRPVLVLSGGLDPITPVKFGEETHARLSNSTLAVLPYQAHGVIVNSRCAQNIVAAFLNAPTQKVDTQCTAADLKPLFLGAYGVSFTPFSSKDATFSGLVPTGWKATQDGTLTFFSSPDGLQFVAAGVYKNQDRDAAKKAVLAQLRQRYGAIDVLQEQTVDFLIISISAVVHTMTTPDQAYTGLIYLRPQGADTYVVWQAAPSNWFQAVSVGIAPTLIGSIVPTK